MMLGTIFFIMTPLSMILAPESFDLSTQYYI